MGQIHLLVLWKNLLIVLFKLLYTVDIARDNLFVPQEITDFHQTCFTATFQVSYTISFLAN